MLNNSRMTRWLTLSGIVMAGILQSNAFPLVIRVYDPAGGRDFAAMKAAAETLAEKATARSDARSGKIDGFSYEIADGPLVPAFFSRSGGAATYIWSAHTLQFEAGFDFRAAPFAFGKKAPPRLAKEGIVSPEAPTRAWTTGFGKAVLTSHSLRLEYELAKGEMVTAALFDARGKNLGNWTWRDAQGGRYVKSISMAGQSRSRQLFLRWKAGDARLVQKVRIE